MFFRRLDEHLLRRMTTLPTEPFGQEIVDREEQAFVVPRNPC